jgi:hypothetical protein
VAGVSLLGVADVYFAYTHAKASAAAEERKMKFKDFQGTAIRMMALDTGAILLLVFGWRYNNKHNIVRAIYDTPSVK